MVFSLCSMIRKFLTYCLMGCLCLMGVENLASAEKMEMLAEEIEPQVVKLRGLPFLNTVEKTFQTPDELQQVLRREMERTYPGDTLNVLEKRLLKFGFIVSPIHLDKLMTQLLSQQIAGYYDPHNRKMVLIEGAVRSGSRQNVLFPLEAYSEFFAKSMGLSLDKILLAHELTHVLQDQHFDLLSLPFENINHEDMAAATRALIEGDATLVMIDYMLQQQEQGIDATQVPDITESMYSWTESPFIRGFGIFQRVPRYIIDNLLFSYLYGFDFVLQLKRRGGWQAVNQAYADFPVSTEQILHPEKYFAERDLPTIIHLPSLPEQFSSWQELEQNTLGEFNIQILIDGFMPEKQSRIAAEGWDGDRFAFYEQTETGKQCLAWYTTWDTEEDAREFFQIYVATLKKRYFHDSEGLKFPQVEDSIILEKENNTISVELRGTDVLVLDGIPKSFRQEALHTFWSSSKEIFH